ATASALPSPSTSNSARGPRTAIIWPGSPCRAVTTPATGLVSSTVALSVMTSATIWSSATVSPTLTCQPTSSASAVPSPTSGSLKTKRPILATSHHDGFQRVRDPLRSGEIFPFKGVRIGRVPAGHARHRRLQVIEAALLHQRTQFAAEARGFRRLVHDDAAAGLLDRGLDGLDVQRNQGAKVDDLGVHARVLGARQRDPDHGAIGQNGDVGAFLHHARLADRLDVFAGRDLGQFLGLPRADRLFVPAVEGAVVEALGLEEDDRIVV